MDLGVAVDAERRADLCEDADHPEPHAGDGHLAAERVDVAEDLAHDTGAQHGDPSPGVDVGLGDVVPARERPVEDVGHALVDPVDGDERLPRPDPHRLPRRDAHRHPVAVPHDPAEQVDVVKGEPAHRRGGAELEAAWHHDDDVRAETLDLLLDLLLRAAADGDQDHDGGHADDDAEHRQDAAHPIGPQGIQSHAERLAQRS